MPALRIRTWAVHFFAPSTVQLLAGIRGLMPASFPARLALLHALDDLVITDASSANLKVTRASRHQPPLPQRAQQCRWSEPAVDDITQTIPSAPSCFFGLKQINRQLKLCSTSDRCPQELCAIGPLSMAITFMCRIDPVGQVQPPRRPRPGPPRFNAGCEARSPSHRVG